MMKDTTPMTARWTFLFFASLTPLIGLSWLASKIGYSLWQMFSLSLVGMVAAAAAASYAVVRVPHAKWPAIVAFVASLPMGVDMVQVIPSFGDIYDLLGVPFVLIVFGALGTMFIALAVIVSTLPPAPKDPAVAPARVVDQ